MKEHTNTYREDYDESILPGEAFADSTDELLTPLEEKAGTLLAVILISLGTLAAFVSLPLGVGLGFIAVIGLCVHSISRIVTYTQTPSGYRSGWTLAGGILLLLLSLFLLWGSLTSPYGPLQMISIVTFALGFFSMASGIGRIRSYFAMNRQKAAGAGWMLAGGVLDILLSLFLVASPVFSWFTLSTVWGIYLIITGASLLTKSLSVRHQMT